MSKSDVRRLAASVAAAATIVFLAGSVPRSNAFVPTTISIVQAMAGALGGNARVAQIRTLFFEWHVLNGQQTQQDAREWMTADGYDRLEVLTTGMQGAPVLRVFTPGATRESVSVTVTKSNRYVPGSRARVCSSQATGALCVFPNELFFDTVTPGGAHPSERIAVSESGYNGGFVESDTCEGIATISASASAISPGSYTVTPRHSGTCSITFASSSPQGWVLEGDQGWPSGNSTGAMQGPDLSREISYVYWMTFAYLHAGGLPGSVRYVPVHGSDEYELEMQPQGGEPIVAEVDEKTFLPDKFEIGSDPMKMIVTPSAWKATDGVLFPTKMDVQLDNLGLHMDYALVRARLNDRFKASLFVQPVPAL